MKKHLVIVLLLCAACSPIVDQHGYVKQAELKEKLVVGQTSKQEVLDQFGSPSAQSSFGDETWYYIEVRKETWAFFAPESVDQDITRIGFDSNGLVQQVESYHQDQATTIDIAKRETPTEGHTLTFLEQALGNIGRFNKSGSAGTAAPGRKPSSGGY